MARGLVPVAKLGDRELGEPVRSRDVSEKGQMFSRFRNSGVSAFQGLESQSTCIIYRTFLLQDDSTALSL